MHLVVFSGGMDSFTLLHKIVGVGAADGREVRAISFDYGQKHHKELDYANRETHRLGIEHILGDMSGISSLLTGSALTSEDVEMPEGHYTDKSMAATVVPGRNTIMLSLAMAYAEGQVKAGAAPHVSVYYGAHQGDHAIYPDCRSSYVEHMVHVFREATEGKVGLIAPFVLLDKGDILAVGKGLGLTGADYARAWTCYKGEEIPCGKCGACVERAEAFAKLGWEDGGFVPF